MHASRAQTSRRTRSSFIYCVYECDDCCTLQMAFTMHLVEGNDDPMQILKDLTAQRQRVLGRRGVYGYEARFKSKECQTGREKLRVHFLSTNGNLLTILIDMIPDFCFASQVRVHKFLTCCGARMGSGSQWGLGRGRERHIRRRVHINRPIFTVGNPASVCIA